MDFKSKIILISGPTASGKSTFAIKVAKKVSGEIINADSMLSALIISPLTFFATFIANVDFPEAVGPDINIILDLKSIINLT